MDSTLDSPDRIVVLNVAGVRQTTIWNLLRRENIARNRDMLGRSAQNLRNGNTGVWILDGQPRFRSLWTKMIADAELVVVITDRSLESFLKSRRLIHSIEDQNPNVEIIAIIAEESDLEGPV